LVTQTKEEQRLLVFEKGAMRRIFGPKKVKVARSWRKLHNEELHNLNPSPNITRVRK
jgi:hypothetical protein